MKLNNLEVFQCHFLKSTSIVVHYLLVCEGRFIQSFFIPFDKGQQSGSISISMSRSNFHVRSLFISM